MEITATSFNGYGHAHHNMTPDELAQFNGSFRRKPYMSPYTDVQVQAVARPDGTAEMTACATYSVYGKEQDAQLRPDRYTASEFGGMDFSEVMDAALSMTTK